MQLTRHTAKLPLARVLALVALLCAGALQMQEAGHSHWHELDDNYSQCLVCKSSGGATLAPEAPHTVLPGRAPTHKPAEIVIAHLRAISPFDARGPPLHS